MGPELGSKFWNNSSFLQQEAKPLSSPARSYENVSPALGLQTLLFIDAMRGVNVNFKRHFSAGNVISRNDGIRKKRNSLRFLMNICFMFPIPNRDGWYEFEFSPKFETHTLTINIKLVNWELSCNIDHIFRIYMLYEKHKHLSFSSLKFEWWKLSP